MDLSRKCSYISNGFYNKGLRLAAEGDMTNAAEALKRALQFNKRNINARNLLGLIYYHVGEVSDALVQWVLSLNLKPADNDADRYLDEVQRQQGLLDSSGEAIQKFNQALALAQGGSEDLAIIQLSKLVEHYPNYVKANTLLALLYLGADKPQKAYRCVQNALRIDKGNIIALRLLDTIRSLQKDRQGKKKADRNRKLSNNLPANKAENSDSAAASDSFNAEPYRTDSVWTTVGNILLGLLIGAASVLFIYLPIKEASMAREYNEKVIKISEDLNRVSSDVKDLESENELLTEENEMLKEQKKSSEEKQEDILSNLQCLVGAVAAYKSDRLTEGAKLYASINPEYMVDIEDGSSASIKQAYSDLKAYYEGEGYDHFKETGDKALSVGNWDSAIENYKICAMICPDRPEALFNEGLAYKKGGNFDHASELFNQVINEFPDSEYADKAREERGVAQ